MRLDDIVEHAALAWLIAALALGVAELAVPGVFLIFLAIAAGLTGLTVSALPTFPLLAQIVSFGIWSGVAVAIGRRWYRDYPVASSDPLLNDRASRIVGEIVVADTPIAAGRGRVRVGDGVWPATGPDAAAGERLRVIAVENGSLVVEPVRLG